MAEVIQVSSGDCLKLRQDILTRFPQLRDWTPSCERCRSMWCNVNVEGFTAEERRALRSLGTIDVLLDGSAPSE